MIIILAGLTAIALMYIGIRFLRNLRKRKVIAEVEDELTELELTETALDLKGIAANKKIKINEKRKQIDELEGKINV